MRYRIDVGLSTFTVRAFASGVLSALAHNPTFVVGRYEGEADIDPDSGAGASLTLTIKAAALELADPVSSKDRDEIERMMREHVLEVARYPTISYDSPASMTSATRTAPGHFDIALGGNLMLHGATHPQRVPARAEVSSGTLRAYGEFSVRQSDYGVKLVTVAGGMIKVRDELQCAFDIVANRIA